MTQEIAEPVVGRNPPKPRRLGGLMEPECSNESSSEQSLATGQVRFACSVGRCVGEVVGRWVGGMVGGWVGKWVGRWVRRRVGKWMGGWAVTETYLGLCLAELGRPANPACLSHCGHTYNRRCSFAWPRLRKGCALLPPTDLSAAQNTKNLKQRSRRKLPRTAKGKPAGGPHFSTRGLFQP
jgi:hypothetical protein